MRVRGRLTLGQQLMEMRRIHPAFASSFRRNRLVCEGSVRPWDIGDLYAVRVEYDLNGRRPSVRVLSPALQRRDPNQPIPHMFSDGTLCLHLPEEWNANMTIAEKIVPWISIWLYYYEIWLFTGNWKGGGHEPHRRKSAAA